MKTKLLLIAAAAVAVGLVGFVLAPPRAAESATEAPVAAVHYLVPLGMHEQFLEEKRRAKQEDLAPQF